MKGARKLFAYLKGLPPLEEFVGSPTDDNYLDAAAYLYFPEEPQ